MKNKSKISTKTIISAIAHVISIVAIILLAYSMSSLHRDVTMLNTETEFLSKQSLQFNGRTNNLEGCFKNADLECPENKYFDASQFMKDENN